MTLIMIVEITYITNTAPDHIRFQTLGIKLLPEFVLQLYKSDNQLTSNTMIHDILIE